MLSAVEGIISLLQKIPATFEGAGFGGVSDATRERLEVRHNTNFFEIVFILKLSKIFS